jgi:hypothetical protein
LRKVILRAGDPNERKKKKKKKKASRPLSTRAIEANGKENKQMNAFCA